MVSESPKTSDYILCGLCPRRFWGGFCKPRNPGVHILLLLVFINLFYTCLYLGMATYYDTFCGAQHVGYIIILIGNVVVLVAGLLSIHFLVQKPAECRISYIIFLHIALIIATGLGVLAGFAMLYPCSPESMRNYAKSYIRTYAYAPYFIRSLLMEKKCCGIIKYKDVFSVYTNNTVQYYRVPPACCRSESPQILHGCKEWLQVILNGTEFYAHHEEYLYQEPCLKEGAHFSTINDTKTYGIYYRNVQGLLGIFVQIIGIVLVLNYYIWFRFPRMIPRHLRPTQFNRDIRNFVTFRWGVLRRELKARRKSVEEAHAKAIKGKSDFTLRHELIKQSIASLRLLHHKELLEAKEKEQNEQPQGGSSPELISTASSNL